MNSPCERPCNHGLLKSTRLWAERSILWFAQLDCLIDTWTNGRVSKQMSPSQQFELHSISIMTKTSSLNPAKSQPPAPEGLPCQPDDRNRIYYPPHHEVHYCCVCLASPAGPARPDQNYLSQSLRQAGRSSFPRPNPGTEDPRLTSFQTRMRILFRPSQSISCKIPWVISIP